MPTTHQLRRQLGLGRAWLGPLEQELSSQSVPRTGKTWDVEGTTTWARRVLVESDLLTTRDYRLVAMRLAGFPQATIRQRAHTNIEVAQLTRTALVVALRYVHDVTPLRSGRARRRLVRDGLPAEDSTPSVVLAQVRQLWLAGAPKAEIAERTGLGSAALLRALSCLPPRLDTGDVTARYGWSAANIFAKISRGTFPPEDGRDPQLRWWWPQTVQAWEQTKNFQTCPHCGARVERLTAHALRHTPA